MKLAVTASVTPSRGRARRGKEPTITRTILVSHHATEQLRRRQHRVAVDKRPFRVVEKEIHDCVEKAFQEGHVFGHKPEGFVLYGARSNKLPPGQRFVQCDDDYGFIVKREPSGDDIVMTMLTRVGVRKRTR
jgi:hypothetical protein